MKVIKNNFENNNENIRREIECTNCKSILEYENKDIISERCINGKQYIICPCCNYIIILNNKSSAGKNNFKLIMKGFVRK